MDVTLELGAGGGDLLAKLKEVRAELAEQKKAAEAVGKANQEAAQVGIKAGDEWLAKQKEMLAVQTQQNERIERQSALIKEMRAEMERLKQSSNGAFNPADVKKFEDEIRRLRSEIEALKNAKKGAKAEPLFTEGSLLEAEATVKRLKLEISQLGPAARKSAVGKELVAELKLAQVELLNVQRQTGIAAAQAGNVVNKAWSFLRQAAYILPGIGIAGIIGAVAAAVTDLVKEFTKAVDMSKQFREVNVEAEKAVLKEKITLEANIAIARDKTATDEQRATAIKNINEMMPDHLKGITQEGLETEITSGKIKQYNTILNAKAKGQAYVAQIQKAYNTLIEIENSTLEENLKWYQVLYNNLATGGNVANTLVRNTRDARENLTKATADQVTVIENLEKALKKALLDGSASLEEDEKKTKATLDKKLQAFQDRTSKIIALEKQLAAARIAIMQDGREKEIAVENARNDDMVKRAVAAIEKYEAEIEKVRDSNKSATNKAKEIAQLTQLIKLEYAVQQQELLTHNAKLLAIDLKYYEDARKALEDSQAAIEDVVLEDQDKEINALNKKYEKLFKAIAEARKKALAATDNPIVEAGVNFEFDDQTAKLTEQQQKENLEIVKKYNLKRIKAQEDLGIAEAGVIQKNGANAEELEKIRQIAVLKVQIEAAKARIELLKDSSSEEDKLIVAQMQAFIEKAVLSIEKLGGKTDKAKANIFGLSNKEMRDLQYATRAFTDSVLSIWQGYIDARVSQQDRLMQKLESDIDKQESLVDKEKDLMEKGYANNYDIEQRKLDDLKRRNNEEVEQMKKLQKEQAAYAKAQQIISGTVAATKLGVAAATYFAEGSQYGPVVGVALALAAIATMVATFASIKNQSKELANFQTYRDGGEFDASGNYATHEQGGINVVDSRSGRKLAEFEKNEYAYFFKDGAKAKQFKPLFDKINKGELSNWRVSPIGLQVPETTLRNIVVQQPSRDSGHLASIDKNVKKLATPAKTTIEYHNGFRIERTGNHTRKIRIKNEG